MLGCAYPATFCEHDARKLDAAAGGNDDMIELFGSFGFFYSLKKKCVTRCLLSERKKRGGGMKGRVDKSMGIVTLIAEALAKLKTELLRRILNPKCCVDGKKMNQTS